MNPAGSAEEHERVTAGGRGPARPDSADIAVTAEIGAEQLTFHHVPQTQTEFTGIPAYESASGNQRANLPQPVEKDVTYRDIQVHYWLAAKVIYPAQTDPDSAR